MDFFDVIDKRCSIRSYKDKPVEEEKVKRILEATNTAPSAGNLQSYEIIVVKDEARKKQIAKTYHYRSFLEKAPVLLIVCTNEQRAEKYGERGKKLYCINDASIAATHIMLAATALGLGTCWVGAFDDAEVSKIIKASPHIKPIALFPVGYPDEEPHKTRRRPLYDLVHEEEF